ncbi:MAG: polyketide synthase, partial [Mycobacteriaceae bacterium]|nr:polyketide synthase [Mycobacteriaceae bacterium]
RGLDCKALRWGLWQGTAIAGADEITRIERSGLVAMDPDAAVTASLCHHPGDPLIMAADLDRLRIFFQSQGASMAFTTPVTAPRGDAVPDSDGSDPKSIADVVRAEVAAVLSLGAPSSVDLNAALVDLGADSLLALDLRDRLRQRTGQSVPAARLLDGTTGAQLIESLQSAQTTGQKG